MSDAPYPTPVDPGPLHGCHVLLLRAQGQQEALAQSLHQLGAQVSHVPVLELLPPEETQPLDAALAALSSYHWLVFTSTNGVQQTLCRAAVLGLPQPLPIPAHLHICAIGSATRQALVAAGLPVHLEPDDAVAEGLVRAFATQPIAGQRILLPRAASGRDVAPDALRAMGATVDVVAAYRTALPAQAQAQLQPLLHAAPPVNWIVFTSASTVKNFLAIGGAPLLQHARTLSIGPATTEVLRKHGLAVHAQATQHDAEGLTSALLQALSPTAGHARPTAGHASMESSGAPPAPSNPHHS